MCHRRFSLRNASCVRWNSSRAGWGETGNQNHMGAGRAAASSGHAPPHDRAPFPETPPRRTTAGPAGGAPRSYDYPERAERRRRRPSHGWRRGWSGCDGAASRAAAGGRRGQGGAAGGHRAAARLPRRHQGQACGERAGWGGVGSGTRRGRSACAAPPACVAMVTPRAPPARSGHFPLPDAAVRR